MSGIDRGRLGRLWRPPRPYGEVEEGRTVSFLELFSDLVYVALVAVAAHELAAHLEWRAVGEFVVIFSLTWIAWLNGAAGHDLHGREDLRTRFFTFLQMLLVALLAVYAGGGAEGRTGFALTFGLLFALHGWLRLTVHRRSAARYRRAGRVYLLLPLLSMVAMLSSVMLPAPAQLWAWAGIVALWVGASLFPARPGGAPETAVVAHSFVERFGLFTIVVLGEVVFGVVNGLSGSGRDVRTVVAGLLALGVGFGLWWTYFDLTGRRLPRPGRSGLALWIPLHLPLTLSVAAAGAAMIEIIAHAGDAQAPPVAAWVLGGAVAVFLLSTAAIVTTLKDWAGQRLTYLPAVVLMVLSALVAVPLIVLQEPGSIELTAALLGVLLVAWLAAVLCWVMSAGSAGA